MALEAIRSVTGRGVVVPGDDIDTDRIIPARYLKCVTFDGLGDALFHDARQREDGTPTGHPLDDARFAGASVMVSGANFGCGSSREHAPQSIYRAGFRAVIAGSFAEIFFGNSTTLGLVCVTATPSVLKAIEGRIAADPSVEITVDVDTKQVRIGADSYDLDMPESAREALLTGYWDPIGELLEHVDSVRTTAAQLGHGNA